MATHLFWWVWCFLLTFIEALPQSEYDRRGDSTGPVWNACGNLIRDASVNDIVYAIDVYNCWLTVPFNSAVATRFLKYWNDTLTLQSSLEYLKNPPQGYQKPPVDLIGGLQQIQNTVNAGGYGGQYEFEADFQRLIYSANDNHVSLSAGLLSSFSFANPYGLTSVSLDGVAVPKVYTTLDLYLNQTKGQSTWQPSAITQINGQDVNVYLSDFAAHNSGGTLEPHADWNTLMDSPVLDVLFQWTSFQGYATFYPGDEFTFTFENGTAITDKWLAIYNDEGDTGPLETGGDFYNFFVLGFYPASYNPPNSTNTTTENPPAATSLSDLSIAYPTHADVYQANLTITGYVTGYFYPESSLAVLSIPTFAMDDEAIQAFSDAVQRFIDQAKAQGLQKVVIDLQENAGGDVILAYNTFKQFFPSTTPFGGSNRRAVPLANTLGSTITSYCGSLSPSDADYVTCAGVEWDALVLLNAATGQNFTSWAQLYGPVSDGVDNFSLTQRLDTQSYTYDYANLGFANPPSPLFRTTGSNPWAASDIVILSDSLCSSACSLFLEFMRFDVGVKNVVVGGRPVTGPMQTPSQSRAARAYSLLELDVDIDNALAINPSAPVPNRYDQTMYIESGGISLRDQVGPNSKVPYQMQYQAADCRIFFTPNTFNNFTNLWKYAADAIWTNPAYCVAGSTGHAPTNSGSSTAPPPRSVPAGVYYDPNGIISGTNSSAAHKIKANNAPMPDADVFFPRTRPYRKSSTSQNPSTLKDTTEPPVSNNNNDKSKNTKSCKFFSSERASAQCERRRKRSVVTEQRVSAKKRSVNVSRFR